MTGNHDAVAAGDGPARGKTLTFASLLDRGSSISNAFRAWVQRGAFDSSITAWRERFSGLYAPSQLDVDLFTSHALVVWAANLLHWKTTGSGINATRWPGIEPFLACFGWLDGVPSSLRDTMIAAVDAMIVAPGDIFNTVYPKLLPHSTRHGSGEYYTPWNLATLMVSETFTPGMTAIDPSCGSGTFVTSLLASIEASSLSREEKREAVGRIAGFDKNPLATFMTGINASIALARMDIDDAFPDLVLVDALDPPAGKGPYDLVIGNPPWVVLGGIENASYKERLKSLATNLGVYIGGKNASNLEIASLFLFTYQRVLTPGGKVFFIMPNSIVTGSQHDKVRLFNGFHEVVAWKFTRQPFKIHSSCIMATRPGRGSWDPGQGVPFVTIKTSTGADGEWSFEKGGHEIYVPATTSVDKTTGTITGVGRLIPAGKKPRMLPIGHSPYMDMFYKGAQVFPRLMFFVDIEAEEPIEGNQPVTIVPSSRVKAKKLARWTVAPYERATVEPRCLFKIAKSTSLVPFRIMEYLDAFLPLSRDVTSGISTLLDDNALPSLARAHFSTLAHAYRNNMKDGGSHETLREIINYQNCITNPRQLSPLKVAYNGGGSIVKAAFVEGDVIVDYSMFYMPVDTREEGYYLLGCLNSPSLTGTVKQVGSTGYHGSLRNIVKHPLRVAWPAYKTVNPDHDRIVNLARQMELRVDDIITARTSGGTRIGIQSVILADDEYMRLSEELDAVVRRILG